MTRSCAEVSALAAVLVVLAVAGCSCADPGTSGNEKDGGGDGGTDAGADTGSDPGSDGDGDSDSDGDGDTDLGAPARMPMTDCSGGKLDPDTNLCWQEPPFYESYSWSDAVAYCDGLSFGGHDDWRLPDIDELISLLRGCVKGEATGDLHPSACGVDDPDCLAGSCNDGEDCVYCAFQEGPETDGCYWDPALGHSCRYIWWSSSTYGGDPTFAWLVIFDYACVSADKKEYRGNVRCVRAGP